MVVGSLGLLAVIPVSFAAARLRTRALWLWTVTFLVVDVALVLLLDYLPVDAAGEPTAGASFTWVLLAPCDIGSLASSLTTAAGACVLLSRVPNRVLPTVPRRVDAVMHCSF